MSNSNRRLPSNGGFLGSIGQEGRLILRLMADSRVNILLKVIPVAAVIYVINPIDFPGPLDDLGIFALGMYAFIEFCPSQVVDEHRARLSGQPPTPVNPAPPETPEPRQADILDGKFRPADPDQKETK